MVDGFSVQSVEIEGFKGFTSPKIIDFKGRHVFLLGQNGNGKSSIVEAVRWGLFGSAYRPNEVIKNQRYNGACRVTVKLMRNGELWTLRRILNLGTGSSSDPTLSDQHGNRRNIREVMPQLDSVDAGEGTHIIFAPQSAPLRRQPEDLDPFERTVFNYLDLTHPRALLSNIEDFLDDQTEAEHELSDELTEARKKIDNQIAGVETRIYDILDTPPWGDELTPSVLASEQKARRFIEEITGKHPSDELAGVSLDALIESARESLDKKRDQNQGNLEKEASELARERGRLENLRNIQIQVRTQNITVQDTHSKLGAILNGLTIDELKKRLEVAKHTATTESIKGRIMRDALDLIARNESEQVPCPICDSHHEKQTLESTLQNTVSNSKSNINSTVTTLESQIQASESLENLLKEHKSTLASLNRKETVAKSNLSDGDKRKLAETNDANELMEDYSKKESVLKAQIDDQQTWFKSRQAQLNNLTAESQFHRIHKRLTGLQSSRKELERAIEAYDNLVAFGQSVRTINGVVKICFNEQLARDIPRVSETLSRAFGALTQHPWYDRLTISEATLPKLQLRVRSSKDPIGAEDPTGVLNGQAESALNLVPYFAFSQSEDTPTEVYLVMLDDPTRALDTEHIRILVERLRELGRNVQLIVASQETRRFRDMIPDVFDRDSYVIVEPTSWSPDSGPDLKIEYD